MKTAVVYYSLDENSDYVANEIKSQINADLIRLHTADEKKRSKIGKIFWSFGLMFSKKNPPLKPYTFDASAYDLIIIGAPVWGGMPPPPLRTFISESEISGKKIAFFVCHAGSMGEVFRILKATFADNEIVSTADFKNPVKNANEIKQQIADWVKGLGIKN